MRWRHVGWRQCDIADGWMRWSLKHHGSSTRSSSKNTKSTMLPTTKILMRLLAMKMSTSSWSKQVRFTSAVWWLSTKTWTSKGRFIPTRRTPGVSTSELLERIVSGYRKRDFDDKLVKMGHSELKAEGSDYDEMSLSSRSVSRNLSPIPRWGLSFC